MNNANILFARLDIENVIVPESFLSVGLILPESSTNISDIF
ncbi:MAG: hypothetical protein P9M11_01170 [Candidatus Tenebribacter burtonii]|nr:hypothetical protein [Candidatus Tenebribacter burtonii]